MTILIVEDDLNLAELIAEQLKLYDYNVHHVPNAQDAFFYLKNNSPYIMLLDYSLPDINGEELVLELMKKYKEIPPFVVVTGHGDERIAVEMMKLGARDYIIKDLAFFDKLPTVIQRVEKEINNERKLKQVQQELLESEKKYRIIVENITDALIIHDFKGNIQDLNENACRMLGFKYDELIGANLSELSTPEESKFLLDQFAQIVENDSILFESTKRTKKGFKVPVEISAKVVSYKGEGIIHSFFRDITDRKRYEEQLKYLSLYDKLTNLYNRTFFEEELNRLEGSRLYPITIISSDVDGLKLINDTLGHDMGDKLLISCAKILQASIRKSDILARIGGDEFSIILPSTDEKMGKSIIERIQQNVRKYYKEHPESHISMSLGMSTAKNINQPLIETLKLADDAMYKSKLHKGASAKSHIITTLMTALGERDYITEGHGRRLAEISKKIGKNMGLSVSQIDNLNLLAQVHDLGKVGTPDNILFKEGPLTEAEWVIMKQHPEKGYRIAVSSPDLAGIADLILKHHERWDGKGYPLGIKGKDIPIECRILSIVDAFDAMTSDRPYRKAISHTSALAEIRRCAGTQFDPELVEIFISISKEA